MLCAPGLGDPRARRWLQAKMTAQLDGLRAMEPDSGRNHAVNAIAYSLGHYVPAWLSEQEVVEGLYDAAASPRA